jgi:hypothetical protein
VIVTEPKIAEALEGLEKAADDLATERNATGQAAENGLPNSTALRAALDVYQIAGLRLKVVARTSDTEILGPGSVGRRGGPGGGVAHPVRAGPQRGCGILCRRGGRQRSYRKDP